MTAGGEGIDGLSTIKRALLARQFHEGGDSALVAGEPIALIGMACRYPGGADTPERFWDLISKGVDAITTVPGDRWDIDGLYDADPFAPGTMNSRWGGFVDDIAGFDARFFGISPREATRMDPQQRMTLEVAVEALERAGQPLDGLTGTQTGVFMASSVHDYAEQLHGSLADVDAHSLTGNTSCIIANRLSFLLDLRGPSATIDTACSSSLVAVHLACQSLRSRDSDLAIAGGVNTLLSPTSSVAIAKWGLMAPDGRCKTFDAGADGFVRSEGCGIVVLKRLADAISDNDPVLAVIRGSAVNQDGRSTAMSAPNGPAQQDVIRRALRAAGARPESVSCVEAHGTGTEIGDPIEVEALSEVYGAPVDGARPLALTAVKTNIGHAEAAAGVAGLIKVVLCLQHETIAPVIHFERLNPYISLDGTRLVVPTTCEPWPAGGAARLAGVSSFGFGGTNAHVLVEESPALPASVGGEAPYLVLVSAQTPAALSASAERLAAHVEQSDADLADVSYTTVRRRTHFDERAGVVARTREELADRLRQVARGELRPGAVRGRHDAAVRRRPAFVFSGQGTQWWGMARELLATSATFRDVVERCDQLLREHVEWSLIDELAAAEPASRLDQTEVAQPALFAVQVGLAAVWQELGIVPAAVAGHSVGEIAAAHVAGALTLEDAVRVVAHRGRLMQAATGTGTMASIGRAADVVRAVIAPYGDRLSIAALNAPEATVISGETAAMAAAVAELEAGGAEVRALPVDYAFHSAQMAPHADALRSVLGELTTVDGRVPFVSTVDGGIVPGAALRGDYWARNVRETVRFGPAVEALAGLGCDVFIEVGPNPVLGGAIAAQIGDAIDVVVVPSLRRGRSDLEMVQTTAAALHCAGVPIDWPKLVPGRRAVVPLPTYPWEHEQFWLAQGRAADARRQRPADGGHPLLGRHIRSPIIDGALFESELLADVPAFLADHRIGEVTLVPGVAFLELGVAAYEASHGYAAGGVDDLTLHAALALSDDGPTLVQTHLLDAPDGVAFSVSSSTDGERWTLHATGTVRPTVASPAEHLDLDAVRRRCPEQVAADAVYAGAARRGTDFGDAFRGVTEVLVGAGEVLARVCLPPELADDGPYSFHPALLDACVHGAELLLPEEGTTYLPVAIARFGQRGPVPREVWAHVRVDGAAGDDTLFVDVAIHDASGAPVAELERLRLLRTDVSIVAALTGRSTRSSGASRLLRQIAWEPAGAAGELPSGPWLVVADAGGVGQAAIAALQDRGVRCEVVAAEVELTPAVVADAIAAAGATEVVYLRMLDTPPLGGDDDVVDAQRRGLDGALAVAASGSPADARLWLVTRGAHPVDGPPSAPEQATLSGFGASLSVEHPGIACVRVDLDPHAADDAAAAALLEVLAADGREELVGVRGGVRRVARLVPVESGSDSRTSATRLVSHARGSLDALHEEDLERQPPGDGQIEIRVDAVGLNFRDVLVALDLYPEPVETFGEECAGEIVRVGPNVEGFRPGDRVMAMGSGSFADFLVTDARLAAAVPDGLGSEEAATIPIAFLTAHHALVELAGLRAGERVLIHAGAGGVGMAAIQIARHLGAEVFATAGTPEKRERVMALGVAQAFDSRSLDFADGILAATEGRGVDVVLNSLSDEFIARSFDVLAEGGRFLEIGRRGIWSEARAATERPDAAYSIVFLGDLSLGDPSRIQAMYQELLPLFGSGALSPLPRTVFATDRSIDAFRFMAQARHIGKIVVDRSGGRDPIRPDGTYLITGGAGGIGGRLAKRLVELGARHVAIAGRSEPGEASDAIVAELAALGAEARGFRADVAVRDDVARLIADVDATMPPLCGVVHAAGLNDDALLEAQTWTHFDHVLRPKVAGAWHLHDLTRDRSLSTFVVVSSASAVLGASAQLNYAAANAFLDAFAAWRSGATGVGVSIAWGPWDRVGMTARLDEQDIARLRRRGLVVMPAEDAVDSFAQVVGSGGGGLPSHVVVVDLDPATSEDRPLLAELGTRGGTASSASPALLEQWIDAVPGMRRAAVSDFVVAEAMKVLGLPTGSSIGPRQPFHELGLDSLMAVELRNAIGAAVGRPQPATLLFDHPTTDALVDHLLDLVGSAVAARRPGADEPPAAAGGPSNGTGTGARDADIQSVAELTEEEAEAVLLAELGEMDGHG